MRIECRRTMEAIVENTPRQKTKTRPSFSRLGRWILSRVFIGKAIIQKSVRMLMELVAVWNELMPLFEGHDDLL